MTCLVAVVVAGSSAQKLTTVALLAMNNISGRNMRVVWPMPIPVEVRLLSLLLTCSMGGDDEVGEWMRGVERRCIDEYALAVKGGENGYADMLRYRRVWRSKTR